MTHSRSTQARLGVGAEKRSKSGGHRTDMQPCFVGVRYGDPYIPRCVEPYLRPPDRFAWSRAWRLPCAENQGCRRLGRQSRRPAVARLSWRRGSLPTTAPTSVHWASKWLCLPIGSVPGVLVALEPAVASFELPVRHHRVDGGAREGGMPLISAC